MKVLLKTLCLAIVITASIGSAKDDSEKQHVKEAKQGYSTLLKSDNPLLRHEGICQLAQLKSQYPHIDFKDCKKQLEHISKKDPYYHLRDYATLCLMYIQDELLSKEIKLEYKGDPTEFFDELHELAHLYFYEDVYFKDKANNKGDE